MPFDGCMIPYYAVCKLINTEFTGFNENLVVKGTDIINKSLDIVYNHERTTDILSIKTQLNKRKSQFIDKICICTKKSSKIREKSV
jgi:hypothetical protein